VGGAVVRNRAKRVLREVFRRNRASLAGVSADVVIVARTGFNQATYGEIESAYRQSVHRELVALQQAR